IAIGPSLPIGATARRVRGHAAPARAPSGDLLVLVDLDEMQVVVGDLRRRGLAVKLLVQEALERVPPDRTADGEADEALHRRRRPQPLLHLVGGGAASQQDAGDALATLAGASLLGQHRSVGLLIDALD